MRNEKKYEAEIAYAGQQKDEAKNDLKDSHRFPFPPKSSQIPKPLITKLGNQNSMANPDMGSTNGVISNIKPMLQMPGKSKKIPKQI